MPLSHPTGRRSSTSAFDDPRVGCVGGTCRPQFETARPGWLSERLLQFAGITRIGSSAREARTSAEYPFGANICFRRDALVQAGGFAEELGRSGQSLLSGEESAVIDRLRTLGWLVWLEPGAVVDHTVAAERCSSSTTGGGRGGRGSAGRGASARSDSRPDCSPQRPSGSCSGS